MRLSTSAPLVLLAVFSVLAMGCRSSHDADADELASLQTVADSLWGSQSVDGDLGEASVGELAGNYALLMALSESSQQSQGPLGNTIFSLHSAEHTRDLAAWAESGRFLSQARESWPECVSVTDNGVAYNECEYGVSGDDSSVSFRLDGSYNWFDEAADADLTYDFSMSSPDISLDWLFHWGMDIKWTETTLEGSFSVSYAYGVSLGGSPPLGGRTFQLNGSIESLTAGESCNGPVSGSLDWTSSLQEGIGPPDNSHVTIEWTACGEATITM